MENTTDFRIRRFLLRLFTPFALAWMGVSGVAFITSMISQDGFILGLVFLLSFLLGPVVYLLGALLIDYDRLARLSSWTLAKRSVYVFMACILLPQGCSYFSNDPGITERELRAYFVAHRSELDQLIQLHQADPTLKISKEEGYWNECTGRPESILGAKKAVDSLYPAIEIESSREPFELKVILLKSEGSGFFERTDRGILYSAAVADFEQELAPSRDFDRISEYNIRFLRPISGRWNLFHHRTTD